LQTVEHCNTDYTVVHIVLSREATNILRLYKLLFDV